MSWIVIELCAGRPRFHGPFETDSDAIVWGERNINVSYEDGGWYSCQLLPLHPALPEQIY